MNRKKHKVSLLEFLKTGVFGPFIPRRNCSPEEVIKIFGGPDEIEVCGQKRVGDDYNSGDARCFPVIVVYGSIEFHFDSPSTLLCIFYDCPFKKVPSAGTNIKLMNVSLFTYRRPMDQFMSIAKSRGLTVEAPRSKLFPEAFSTVTTGGVEIGFETDELGETPTLRWFSWQERAIGVSASQELLVSD